jgi:hypothetical protein
VIPALSYRQAELWVLAIFLSEVGRGTDQSYPADLLNKCMDETNQNLSLQLLTVLLAYADHTLQGQRRTSSVQVLCI